MIEKILIWIKKIFKLKEKPRPKSNLKKTGALVDELDSRDHTVELTGQALPDSVDLRKYVREVKSQGKWNSCLSFAICSAVELQLNIRKRQTFMPLSEKFNYYYGRQMCGFSTDRNIGMYPRVAIKAAFKYGLAPEITCSYTGNMSQEPTQMAKIFAHPYKQLLKEYKRVYGENSVKQCLNELKPVIFVIETYNYWLNIRKDGLIRKPALNDKSHGNHGVLCCGFNEKGYIILNSWNLTFGEMGYCYLPYDYPKIKDLWLIELK